MAAPPTTHPVAAVLRRRRGRRSLPGARDDAHRVALVLEGGGMRGVVSAAMTAAIERLGLTGAFDLVVGSSAGAVNGAALLGGAAAESVAAYCGPLASRRFINPARLARGKPALDAGLLMDLAARSFDPERHARALSGPVTLHCVALDVDTAQPRTFSGMRTQDELWAALLATTRMPFIGGDPVVLDGRRYIDGALVASIPLAAALAAGATHVLVLQTRPYGVPRTTGSRVADVLIERHLRRLNPALVKLWRERASSYEVLVDDIARRSLEPGDAPPLVLGVRPPAGTPVVHQLERRPDVLREAARGAERLVEALLGATDDEPLGATA